MPENWKPISDYEGAYEVSNMGRVRSLDRSYHKNGFQYRISGKTLKQNQNGAGYYQVVLSGPKGQWNAFVHRLVAREFCAGYADNLVVRHLDGNKGNNRAENLAWGTRAENMADCKLHGTSLEGERNPGSSLKERDVIYIRYAFKMGATRRELARTFGVHVGTISSIVCGNTWSRTAGPIAPKVKGHKTSCKLTEDQVANMREEYAKTKITQQELADRYGVSRPTISLALRGKNWADV